MHLSFGVSDSLLALLFCERVEDFSETLVILSPILLQIKSPVASAVFWITLYEALFIASAADFFALSRSF